jgi:hypothetical protein
LVTIRSYASSKPKIFKALIIAGRMEYTYLRILDNHDARGIFLGLQFYSRNMDNNQEVKVRELGVDKNEHRWEEETLEFPGLKTQVKLIFYNLMDVDKKGLPIHTLEMELFGEHQAREDTLKRLEAVTGIDISKYKTI